MVALIACWVAFPVVFGLLAYGCGAIVERAAGRTLPFGLLLPCGTALMIGVLDLATRSTATVPVAVPAVLALAVAGLVIRRPWRLRGFDRAVVAAVVVFAVYAAPIVLSGMATWAGYVKLDDTATWLALVDRTLTAGHTLSGLGPSTYRDTLASYLTNGYPVGSFLPLGVGHDLLGQDIAWLVDPWMAFMAAMLTLSLERIAARALGGRETHADPGSGNAPTTAIAHSSSAPAGTHALPTIAGGQAPPRVAGSRASRRRAPIIAIFAAQPALLYGYYLWGGIKEMAGAMLIAAFATTAPLVFEGERRGRALIPALVVVWAMLAALSTGGLVWLVPGGVLGLLLLSARREIRLPSLRTSLAAVGVCVVAAYLTLRPGGFLEKNKGELTGGSELGNLLAPLHFQQIVGIWPAGDFRAAPAELILTDVLIALAVVAGVGGLVVAAWRARRELTLYVLCSLAGALLVFEIGSPWLGGKALASASPAVALVALVACTMLLARGQRALGLLAGGAIAAGIVWSNVLGYHDASLAPRAQFVELAAIGHRIAGQGPTLMTDYSPFGARHFLREAEPESASELRSREDPLRSGEPLPKGATADIDEFQLSAVLFYRTLVLRRSPVESRPPSPFKLILRDRYWEVWQRPAGVGSPVLAHMPLGNVVQPGGVPSCKAVSELARTPGAVKLVAPPVENPIVVGTGEGTHPTRWSDGPEHLTLTDPGTAQLMVTVRRAGRYAIWLGGSIAAPVTIAVNGVAIGTARYETQEDGQYVPFGAIGLERGSYRVSITYHGGDWRPGSGGTPATVGPLILQREIPEQQPITVPVTAARSLCGRTLDWVEALGT
jgi:hypothetical protein